MSVRKMFRGARLGCAVTCRQLPAAAGHSQVWRPGAEDDDDVEDLEYDPSAYDCLHAFQLEWPCLRCAPAGALPWGGG